MGYFPKIISNIAYEEKILSEEELGFKKELIGCFGDPIWENPTEIMMEAAFQHHNMDYRYITTLVTADNLEAAFEGVKAMGYKGFNCTLPHKVAIINLLDGLGESAAVMGAVNCVVECDGKYIGENTDGKGYMDSLREIVDPVGKKAVIFGAGGAARAISVELALAGATAIIIVNRSTERGQTLVDILNDKTPVSASFVPLEGDYEVPEGTNIVINSTNIGLYPDTARVPVALDSLSSTMIISDVIPNPPKTRFIQEATELGCKTIDGLGMLVNQGKIGIRYWSGRDVDGDVMRKSLEDIF